MRVRRAREAVSSIEIIPAMTINFRWNAGSRAPRVFPLAWRTMKTLCRDHFRFAPDTREQASVRVRCLRQPNIGGTAGLSCLVTTGRRMRMTTFEFFKRTIIVAIVVLVPLLIWLLFDVVLVLIGSILICVLLQLVSEPFTRWCKLPRALALGISGVDYLWRIRRSRISFRHPDRLRIAGRGKPRRHRHQEHCRQHGGFRVWQNAALPLCGRESFHHSIRR
jgi:hypothetical protein